MKRARRFSWPELAGLFLAQSSLIAQSCFLLGVLFGGLGSFPERQLSSVSTESMSSPNLVWGLWALFITPIVLAETLVLEPIVCLWILRSPTPLRRRVVLGSVLLTIVNLALSAFIALAVPRLYW